MIVRLAAWYTVEACIDIENSVFTHSVAIMCYRLEHMLLIRNCQLIHVWSSWFLLLINRLATLSARITILNHIGIRVMTNWSTSLFDITDLIMLRISSWWSWLYRTLSFFVAGTCSTKSVMSCWSNDLTLIKFVFLFNRHTIFSLGSWSISGGTSQWEASRLIFSRFTLSLPSIYACRKRYRRLTLLGLFVWLACTSELYGVVNWSWEFVLMTNILALIQLLYIASSWIINVLGVWSWYDIAMIHSWWMYIRLTILPGGVILPTYLDLLWSISGQNVWASSYMLMCRERRFSLRYVSFWIGFLTMIACTHDFTSFCIMFSFIFKFWIMSTCSTVSATVGSEYIWWLIILFDILHVHVHRLCAIEDWFVDPSCHRIYVNSCLPVGLFFKCSKDLLL